MEPPVQPLFNLYYLRLRPRGKHPGLLGCIPCYERGGRMAALRHIEKEHPWIADEPIVYLEAPKTERRWQCYKEEGSWVLVKERPEDSINRRWTRIGETKEGL